MDFLPGLILIALAFVGFGLIQLFLPDVAWDMAQWGNAIYGRTSERTRTWDMWRVLTGIVSIVIGIALCLMAWQAVVVQQARDAEAASLAATRAASTPTFEEILGDLLD